MVAFLRVLPLYLMALAAPVSVAGGNVAAGLILVWAVVLSVRPAGRPRHLPPRDLLLALGAYLLVHALATALSSPGPMRWEKFGEELWFKLLLVGVPLVAAGQAPVVRRAVGLVLASGLVAAVYGVVQHFTGWDLVRQERLLSFAGHPIAIGFSGHHLSYGGQVMLLLVLAMAWLRQVLLDRPRRLWLPAVVCLVMGLALIWSFARSAQLGAFAAAVFLALSLPRPWRRAGVAALVAVVVLAVAMPVVRTRVAEAFTDEKEVTRPNLWRSSVAGIAARPLLGWGPGNFHVMLEFHEYPGYYESRAHSHNDYLMHAVNAGLLGLAAALWLLWTTVKHLFAGWRRGGPGSWILLGALACQVAVSVAGIFQVYQTDDEPEMLLYFLVGCGLALMTGSAGHGTDTVGDVENSTD
jgi:putative inorganic carbon (HCO3(-)) transporter